MLGGDARRSNHGEPRIGHFDFDFRDAIRDIEAKAGQMPDGRPTAALLAHPRGITGR